MNSSVRCWLFGAGLCALLIAQRGASAQSADAGAGAGARAAGQSGDPPGKSDGKSEAGADKGGEAPPAEPSVTGGYTWSDPPRKSGTRQRPQRPAKRIPRDAPIATFPGFRMLPGGGSRVWVSVSKEVPVKVHEAAGRVSYLLEGAHVQVLNNTYPLVTTHFNTPVQRIRLVRAKSGVELVVELREPVSPVHRTIKLPRGMMRLEVELPAATRTWTPPREQGLRLHGGAGPQTPRKASRSGKTSSSP